MFFIRFIPSGSAARSDPLRPVKTLHWCDTIKDGGEENGVFNQYANESRV